MIPAVRLAVISDEGPLDSLDDGSPGLHASTMGTFPDSCLSGAVLLTCGKVHPRIPTARWTGRMNFHKVYGADIGAQLDFPLLTPALRIESATL